MNFCDKLKKLRKDNNLTQEGICGKNIRNKDGGIKMGDGKRLPVARKLKTHRGPVSDENG